MYTDREIISKGNGICMRCKRGVGRILVGEKRLGGEREWRLVDWHRGAWLPHRCPTGRAAA